MESLMCDHLAIEHTCVIYYDVCYLTFFLIYCISPPRMSLRTNNHRYRQLTVNDLTGNLFPDIDLGEIQ
jgi:hypothetical protein